MKLAIYDTGYGLSVAPEITDENGEVQSEVFTPAVVGSRFFKVKLPDSGPNWETEWETQKKVLRDMVDAYNEKHEGGK